VDHVPAPAPPAHRDRSDPASTITPCKDGPLLVRGDFRLLDQDGVQIEARRSTVALCRCGMSGIKPFCDHKLTGFSAASAAEPGPGGHLR